MRRLDYQKARSLEEALSFISRYGERAKLLAGGTDLFPQIKRKKIEPEILIDLTDIKELNFIKLDFEEVVRIGSLTTLRSLVRSDIVRNVCPLLSEAAHTIGSQEIRNVATAGGNICNAAPSADLAPAMIALGGSAKILGGRGERVVDLEDFFLGPSKTTLASDEILLEFQFRKLPPLTGCVYLKHTIRKAMDTALVGVAVTVNMDLTKEVCNETRIVLGAVAPTPLRVTTAEEILRGRRVSEEVILEAAQKAAGEASPISDIRSSAEYRKEMVRVLTGWAIKGAVQRTGH